MYTFFHVFRFIFILCIQKTARNSAAWKQSKCTWVYQVCARVVACLGYQFLVSFYKWVVGTLFWFMFLKSAKVIKSYIVIIWIPQWRQYKLRSWLCVQVCTLYTDWWVVNKFLFQFLTIRRVPSMTSPCVASERGAPMSDCLFCCTLSIRDDPREKVSRATIYMFPYYHLVTDVNTSFANKAWHITVLEMRF